MKFVIIALLAFLLTFTKAETPAQEVIDVLEGILVGSFGEIGHEVQECIQDGEIIFEDIKHAIPLLEQALKTKNIAELTQALQYIGDALKRIPEEVKDCEALPEVVKDLEKIAAEFLAPEALIIDIGEKLLWHGISIYHDVTKSVSDFKSDHFFEAGEDIGDIVRIIFLTMPQDPADNVVDFFNAFYSKAFSIKLHIQDCKNNVTAPVMSVVDAVQQIIHGDFSALPTLLTALQQLKTAAQGCEAAWPEVKEGLEDMMPFVNHPASIVVAVSEAAALDPISFPKDAWNLYHAFTADPVNYKLGGESSGDLIHMILKYMPKDSSAVVEQYLKQTQ